ncbi:MAG: hypothetical protein NWQ19_03170, partial [Nonlabens sp.]|nr:hypothetical protein [Nonlabens sp.]
MKLHVLIVISFFALAMEAHGQKIRTIDWINAPLNPKSPVSINHIDANGPLNGDIVAVDSKWYGTNKGTLLNKYLKDADLAVKFKAIHYTEDAVGNVLQEVSYYSSAKSTMYHTYDSEGFYTSKTKKEDNRNYTFEYDKKGRIIKEVLTGKDFAYTTNYTYATKGKVLEIQEKQYSASNELVNHFIYTYENGLIRSWEEVGQQKYTYDYEYDSNKNWVKRIKTKGTDVSSDFRTIIYRNQIKDPSAIKLVVEKGSYKPLFKVYIDGVPTTLMTFTSGEDVYFYNPLQEQYFKAAGAKSQLIPTNIGKEVAIIGYDK